MRQPTPTNGLTRDIDEWHNAWLWRPYTTRWPHTNAVIQRVVWLILLAIGDDDREWGCNFKKRGRVAGLLAFRDDDLVHNLDAPRVARAEAYPTWVTLDFNGGISVEKWL